MTIGDRIRIRREELGLSQEELARRIGYKSRSSINKIEMNNYNLVQSKIKAVADALETTPSYIMGWRSASEDQDGELGTTYDKDVFAQNLNAALNRANMTKTELAERLNVSKTAVTTWCKGTKVPRMDKIEALSKLFGMQKSELIEMKTNYLADRRKELNLTQEYVAKIIGVSPSTIVRYESGEIANMKRDKILKYSQALQTTTDFIMNGPSQSKDVGSKYTPSHRIPIMGYISAGLPLYAEEHIEGYTYTELNGGAEYFALRVKGDSMNAVRIYDGDLLIVRRQDTVENGEIAVVLVNGDDATVKRFHRDGNTITLIPCSSNPEHHPQIYNLHKTQVKILGRVVQNQISF